MLELDLGHNDGDRASQDVACIMPENSLTQERCRKRKSWRSSASSICRCTGRFPFRKRALVDTMSWEYGGRTSFFIEVGGGDLKAYSAPEHFAATSPIDPLKYS